jgi:divalent metal cation (Fe/Co/Zn/Cd) transporter
LLGIAIAMGAVAIATIVMSTLHLLDHAKAHTSVIGTTVAALSIVVLGTLARGKTRIGRDIGSRALVADGHLSLIGAVLATVTTAGTIATAAFGWWWLDAIASIAVACIAAGVAFDHARHAASAPNELA